MLFLFSDDSKKEIVGYGVESSFEFTMDFGGMLPINTYKLIGENADWQQIFQVIITPPNQFTVGKMDEETKTLFLISHDMPKRAEIKLVKMTLEYVSEGTAEFKAMAPEKRNCLYPDEKQLEFFTPYSEANCILECTWHLAMEKCGCVPWFLLTYFPEARMCEAIANKCFRGILDKRYNGQSGNTCKTQCLPDCESVQYDITPGSENAYVYLKSK